MLSAERDPRVCGGRGRGREDPEQNRTSNQRRESLRERSLVGLNGVLVNVGTSYHMQPVQYKFGNSQHPFVPLLQLSLRRKKKTLT